MEITVNEALTQLKSYNNGFTGYVSNMQDSIDVAIETMRKYQKIQEIVNSKTTRLSYEKGFRQIKEVVEDGRN